MQVHALVHVIRRAVTKKTTLNILNTIVIALGFIFPLERGENDKEWSKRQ